MADTKDYILRDIPPAIHAAAMKRADADGLPLRAVLIGLLEVYAERGVRILPRTKKSRPKPRS